MLSKTADKVLYSCQNSITKELMDEIIEIIKKGEEEIRENYQGRIRKIFKQNPGTKLS